MTPQIFYQLNCPTGQCEHSPQFTHHPADDPSALHDMSVHLSSVHGYELSHAIRVTRDLLNNARPTSLTLP